jgi:RimJ/RimL family protein N-acetyltransferase
MTPTDYDRIACKRLREISPEAIIELINDPAVRRHLPLAKGEFGISECTRFVAAKERIWDEHGFGPWAFLLDGEFIGWGGLQPEGDDVDAGLVLHRKHWGAGPALFRKILEYAFDELGLDSVIALLPPSRTRTAALRRLGFHEDGESMVGDERFVRYRLDRGDRSRPARTIGS